MDQPPPPAPAPPQAGLAWPTGPTGPSRTELSAPPPPPAAPAPVPDVSTGWARRRAFRDLDAALVGGVAAGVARHLGLPTLWVRGFFVVATAVGGLGLILYAALWVTLPASRDLPSAAPGLAAASRQGKRPGRRRGLADLGPLVALGAVAFGVVAFVGVVSGGSVLLWPLVLAVVGIAVLWRQGDEAQRARWLDASERIGPLRAILGIGGWAAYARILAGVLLLVGAIVLFAIRGGDLGVARDAVIAALLAVLGVGLMVAPWLYRLSTDLSEERAERIRTEERADVAAHLHDSVLQTLALIQKTAHDPTQVSRLARAQERDLRAWLYTSDSTTHDTVAAALRAAAAQVEDGFGVPVEVVCVGETLPLGSATPLVEAAREAMVNAAKHANADHVDVYAESSSAEIEVFVRDRGAGFDPDRVPHDRYGVRHSIVDRMRRHGGAAAVRSTPGQGTEVRLSLPVTGPSAPPSTTTPPEETAR